MVAVSVAAVTVGQLPWGTVALVCIVWALGYFAACAFWPWTAHGRCKGTGKRRSPSGKKWRTCRGCKGTGRRIRLGRRVWTSLGGARNSGS